jgi:kinesin family protein 4/21/27
MENRVKVGIRIRPLSTKEIEEGSSSVVQSTNSGNGESVGKRIKIDIPARNNSKFDFDWVFGPQTSQQTVFDNIAAPLIDNIFSGFNGTIFAYGQTGSGKTHTMGGCGDTRDGVVYTAIDEVFKKSQAVQDGSPTMGITLQLSYLEIYKEECFDLLAGSMQDTAKGGQRTALQIREIQGSTVVDGLTTWPISSTEEACKLLNRASEGRSTSKTAMNSLSSRSHSLCTLTLRISSPQDSSVTVSKLHLVDLAGSERAKKTLATGDIFSEVSTIY